MKLKRTTFYEPPRVYAWDCVCVCVCVCVYLAQYPCVTMNVGPVCIRPMCCMYHAGQGI